MRGWLPRDPGRWAADYGEVGPNRALAGRLIWRLGYVTMGGSTAMILPRLWWLIEFSARVLGLVVLIVGLAL